MRQRKRDNVVNFPPTRRWTKPGAYLAAEKPPRRASSWLKFLPLWGGAALVGTAFGAGWMPNLHRPSINESSDAPAVSTTFGTCHVGGGINCVVDGDTFYLEGVKVRIAGIDAPETHPSRCEREAELGRAATERLRELLNSGPVQTSSIDRDEDRYGRKLRNVSVNGEDVGYQLISAGLARAYAGSKQPWC